MWGCAWCVIFLIYAVCYQVFKKLDSGLINLTDYYVSLQILELIEMIQQTHKSTQN